MAQDAGRSAVISTEFAQRNFGSPSAALGHTVGIEGTAYEIVGVMPSLFRFPQPTLVWAATSAAPHNQNRSGYNYRSVARLLPGISPRAADAQLLSIADRLAGTFPDTNRNKTFIAVPLQDQLAAPVRTTLFLLMGAVALVLLIACANVANLMLARATSRVHEMAMRAVLGAGRWRIAAQLLSESVVLASAAAILGMLITVWATKALLIIGERFVPAPLLSRIQFDWRLLGFTIFVSLVTSILFGVAPAWQASRIDLHCAVKQSANRGVLGGGHSRVRNLLVVAQIALSLALAVGAGLLIRTLVALQHSQLGYRTGGILVAYASAPARTLPDALRANRLFNDLFSRLGRLPGAISAAGAMGLPAGQYNSDGFFVIEGRQSFKDDYRKLPYAGLRLASPNYFKTMGIPLLRGRDFDDGDVYDRLSVAIVSDSLARQDFPNEDPIGHRIQCGLDLPIKWMTIVGVVGDIRQSSPAAQPGSEIYMPLQQHPFQANDVEIVIRAVGDPEQLIPPAQKEIRDADPEIAMKFTTMRDLVSDSIGAQRFRTVLASIFAGLAVLLALSGMYAVMSYVTAQRTSEFGLRSALGAQKGSLIRLVLRGAARIALVGTGIGLLFSFATGRLLTSMLFGVNTLDPLTYTSVIAVVLPVILLAA
ncbi:MAG TPA: ABC transporter permease, partial [Candidatus Acidoferrales bacterium]|nr:ABC transporter permease [Candidatus Acidoferrales bacterium]